MQQKSEYSNFSTRQVAVFMVALGLVLFLHGAVPFVALPTLLQALWTTGFSQSMANDSIFSIYATNFGAPESAAISFGLTGAYPAGLFIAVGLYPADAYAAMAAVWLTVAFFGAWRIGLLFGLRSSLATLAAVLWMSMPVIWGHAGYSMVSLGIGLLPFYFWTALRVFTRQPTRRSEAVSTGALYLVACLIAVFMDGYSFTMFAVGASLLGAYAYVRLGELRRHLLVYAFPIHVVAFALAYLLYASYIGKRGYPADSLDFFRRFGVALTFLAIPTQGMHWVWDALGLSVPRSDQVLFGDASVWMTTFSLPVIVVGLVAWWRTKRIAPLATGFLIIAMFGFYMALGPSLKIDSTRPKQVIEAGKMSPLMPPELAVGPTGSALLSANLPGFKNMRAAYRWSALGVFGLWALIVLLLARENSKMAKTSVAVLVALLILSNLPNPVVKWTKDVAHRNAFFAIDADLLTDMKSVLREGERVAFLPYRNDFLINYLASRLKITTYNVGGDKNLFETRKHWPPTMRQFKMGQVDSGFADRILLLLARQEADAVVLPYIDMLWAPNAWPAPTKFKKEMAPIISALHASGFIVLDERAYHAVARVAPQFKAQLRSGKLEQLIFIQIIQRPCITPFCLKIKGAKLVALPRQVGRIENDYVQSDGRKGFLSFGPYSPLNAGEYHLVVSGAASVAGSAWVDVVSSKGEVEHARFSLATKSGGMVRVLVDGLVKLDKPVDDIEVRVYVGEADRVRLVGYGLY